MNIIRGSYNLEKVYCVTRLRFFTPPWQEGVIDGYIKILDVDERGGNRLF